MFLASNKGSIRLSNVLAGLQNVQSVCGILLKTAEEQWVRAMGTTPSTAPSCQKKEKLRPIYLDAQATTPIDPRVLNAMLPYLTCLWGNPHSSTHAYGWEAEDAVEKARMQVAALIKCAPEEIIFTSGSTESNNLTVKGLAKFYKGNKKHVITQPTEHKCLLESAVSLREDGYDVTFLDVDDNGMISLKELKEAIRPDTFLVSIMAVNNETGVKFPLKEIGAICRSKKVFFHTDASQAAVKIDIDVNEQNIDLMSISSHKIYGPKGVGALYVRGGIQLKPLISGGGQERNMRSGTLPSIIIVGFGEACQIGIQEMKYDEKWIQKLSDTFMSKIFNRLTHVHRNGSPSHPGCVNIAFNYADGDSLYLALRDLAVSSGSACTSASINPSYVLRSMHVERHAAYSSIRFGLGRFTTLEEVDYAAERVIEEVKRARLRNPFWNMVQEGIDLNQCELFQTCANC